MKWLEALSGLWRMVTAFFESDVWAVRGQKLELKDKTLEMKRPEIEAKAEKKVQDIRQRMEIDDRLHDHVMHFVEELEDLPVKIPPKRIERMVKRAERRQKRRM